MGLKSLLQHKENWEEPFEGQAGSHDSHLYWEESSHPHAANRSSILRPSQSSVSHGPLPSFLTQTPLGTPCEDTVEFKPMAEIPVVKKRQVRDPSVPLQRQTVEKGREAPKRFKQKTEQRKKPAKSYRGAGSYGFIYRWVYEEVRLSMSKMSIVSLVLGLLFLGTLFFIIGFLAAVSTIGSSTSGGGSSQSAWQASNTPCDEKKGHGKFGHGLSAIGGGIVGKAVGQHLGPLGKIVGGSSVVPKSLQPFARYGMGAVRAEVRRDVRQVNPFVTRRRGRTPEPAPEQQLYGSQQSGTPQQYAPPQQFQGGQAYGPPSSPPMPVGYQQPTAFPQGGQGVQAGYNQGYVPPQQQQMMQQPYYQQPMQQQAYQQPMQQQAYQQPMPQPMAPQQMMMAPQQQMMPEPQYQQQMPPQQGYYR